ncbi:MAG TPA: hypothetical protein VK666_07305 [Chryseolinea sp.]|nr:hypothetical protein [Chryseolinea sp.]
MKHTLVSLLVIIALALTMSVDVCAGTNPLPDTVEVGMYITSIHNIDLKEREYNITFWLWLKYDVLKFDFARYLEIPSAKTVSREFVESDTTNGVVSIMMKVQCLMKDSWHVENFPFDKQRLWLSIENSHYDVDSLVFVADTTGRLFDRRVQWAMVGWKMTDIGNKPISIDTTLYQTGFGDKELGIPGIYSAFKCVIRIQRDASTLLFWKLFLGMYIAFLISYLCFYIRPGNFDSRFQLSVGALFAAVGNKYIVESSLPESVTFTLVDCLHIITLLYILLTIAATAISLKISRTENTIKAYRFDMISAQSLLFIYIILNIIFIVLAHSG